MRTRFAPSPTGYLHVGGARTALYNYLLVQRHGGQFVLRIEDTDRERSTEASVQAILDAMQWLGLSADEGPFYQTQNFARYRECVAQLLASDQAYHCYCTPDELDAMRTQAMAEKRKPRYDGRCRDPQHRHRLCNDGSGRVPVVRFRNPTEGTVSWDDEVYGRIDIANAELDDLVIARGDGTPTYNLTVVVDDIDMGMTHVVRGDDHINNTPRQINLYRALGAAVPVFAHLPMILGDDGKRLSKRHGAVSVMQYAEDGYLPEALLNYLVRLGWSHGDQELFTREEMGALFDLKQVNRGGSGFNTDKLRWVNAQYLKSADTTRLATLLAQQYQRRGVSEALVAAADLPSIVEMMRERVSTLAEMAKQSQFYFALEYDPQSAAKHLRAEAAPRLTAVRSALASCTPWQSEALEGTVKATVAELGVGFGKLGLPLRVALAGTHAAPAIGVLLATLGQEESLARIDKAIAYIDALGVD